MTLSWFQILVSSPSCYLYFWLSGYESEVPRIFFLGLITLWEQLTQFRETVYQTDYQLIVKWYNTEEPGDKAWGKPWSLQAHGSPSTCHWEAFWTPPFWVLMKTSLQRYRWFIHWSLGSNWTSRSSALPEVRWNDNERSNYLITWFNLLVISSQMMRPWSGPKVIS